MQVIYRAAVILFLLSLVFLPAASGQNDSRIEIYDLRNHTHPTFTRIVVDIGKLREYYYSQLASPDRIYVDIYQSKLNPILHGKTEILDNDYINKIRIAQKNQTTVRVVAEIDFSKIQKYHVWHLFDPFRVVIDIYPKQSALDKSPAASPRPAEPAKDGYSMVRQLGLGIQRIVIDPGHGGKDPGCIGKNGLQEKDVVLDVCKELQKLLSAQTGLEVILTRETDIFLPVENRPVIANQKRADLYISVHANAFPNIKRSGVQTFFLNFSQDDSITTIAARENATSTKNISEMKTIITKITQNSKIVESKELAEKIQKNLSGTLSKEYTGVKDLGAKGGPFWVLIGGEMPSVLVEISHLSNTKEAERLKTQKYRRLVAQGIVNGIKDYMESLGKG
ncbi:MAG: N-acetylmuramoyl-L-alanine amidase [Candidatus Aminicenantes bacterium]|nr:N-acetylmuramoyl-L-alanine amidase [Candidatus Aminicenantes bacterium]